MKASPGSPGVGALVALSSNRFLVSGVVSSCGVQPGPLATIGTSSFCEAAIPASDAACGGAAEKRIAFTPARRKAATWPVMSVWAGVIFALLLLSAVNTAVMAKVAVLYSLAQDRELPRALSRLNYSGVPGLGLIIACAAPLLVLAVQADVKVLAELYAIGVVGALNSFIQNQRLDGFKAAVAEGGQKVEFLNTVDGQNVQDVALSAAENLMTANPDMNALYATGEPALLGAVSAVASQGRGDSIKVFGWDLTKSAIDGIDQGFVTAVIQQDPAGEGKAGLHVDTVPWMHERRIAAFLPDGDGETVPSNVEGMPYPIHPLQLTAMGMLVSDSLQLEDLKSACEEEGRFEFMVVGLPLRLPGATGSPWNPIAIF